LESFILVSAANLNHSSNIPVFRSYFSRRKKAAVASGPKFREETPKKGSDTATPSPYRTATINAALHKMQGGYRSRLSLDNGEIAAVRQALDRMRGALRALGGGATTTVRQA